MAINLNGTGSISGLSSISAPAISGVPAGSESAPAFSFTGDSNTGIYSPGADQVAISTNSTGRLVVDASGNVLVNVATARANITDTSTPRFQIEGTDFPSSYASICRNSDTAGAGPAFALARTRGSSLGSNSAVQSDDVLGTLRFEGNYGTAFNGACAIRGIAAGTFSSGNNPGHLLFLTTPVGSNGSVERLRITAAGLVGIGTSSPAEILDVRRTGVNPVLSLTRDDAATAGALLFGAGNTLNFIQSQGTKDLNFQTNSIERLRIDSSGRLLVGTSSALGDNRIQVQGDANSSGIFLRRDLPISTIGANVGLYLATINFGNQDGAVGASIRGETDATWSSNDYPSRLVFSTTADGASSPTERMRISQNGNIGIGFGTDLARLYIRGQSNTSSTFSTYVTNTDNFYLFVLRDDGALYTGQAGASPYNLTTATAANTVLASDGILYRSTSSARFKTDIETLEDTYADNILNCRPVWYRSTANADDPSWGWWGFIAEEVAEVDPRLVFWKTKESKLRDDYVQEEGKIPSLADYVEVELDTPIAEGVQYDRFVPHLLNLIKRQQQAIETLEAKVAALESA